MSSTSPAGPSRAVRATPTPAPAPRKHLIRDGNGPVPNPPQNKKPAKPKKNRIPLSERLPEGVYDERPRYKRFVFHWLYFWAWARLRLYKTKLPVPRVAVKEQLDRNFHELFELAKTRQPIITCLNSKGGAGKTLVATWLAVLVKLATLRAVYAVDANENKGGTASRLGIDRNDTVQLRSFLRFEKELSTAEAINSALASHVGSGVLVVASEAADKTYFSQRLFESRMKTLHKAGHTLVLDAGNGIPHAANRGSAAIADVLVFPATVKQADSFEDAEDTRVRYAADEPHYGFGNKVENGIIVLLGVSKKERLQYIEQFGWNPEKTFRVPEDQFMVKKHIVTWGKIKPRTQLALSEIAVAIFRATEQMTSWQDTADDTQHMGELGLTEVQFVHTEEPRPVGVYPAGS